LIFREGFWFVWWSLEGKTKIWGEWRGIGLFVLPFARLAVLGSYLLLELQHQLSLLNHDALGNHFPALRAV